MANVRRPRSDAELASEEREALVEQLQQDQVNLEEENQEKLAVAGEPEARAAVTALRAVTRGNVLRMTAEQQEAVGLTDTATTATAPVEDERTTDARADALRKRIAQAKFEEQEARKNLAINDRAKLLMKNHWQRWSREGESNYGRACSTFRLNVGRDAVTLVEGGVFDNHLDVAQFIQRMAPARTQAEETDWTDDLERELKELRGED